jgi:hypothetical protein
MGRTPWGTYLWPGLAQLSRHGNWSALGLALGFALLLNLAICATLVWTELLWPSVRSLIWVVVGLVWGVSVVQAYLWDRWRANGPRVEPAQDPFARALDHYLKGNWYEAERILAGILARTPRDLDAGLMRATMYRHTGRYREALEEIERIERFEGCEKWELEIRRERELIRKAQDDDGEASDERETQRPGESKQPMVDAA